MPEGCSVPAGQMFLVPGLMVPLVEQQNGPIVILVAYAPANSLVQSPAMQYQLNANRICYHLQVAEMIFKHGNYDLSNRLFLEVCSCGHDFVRQCGSLCKRSHGRQTSFLHRHSSSSADCRDK